LISIHDISFKVFINTLSEGLEDKGIIDLNDKAKETLVINMMTVLVGDNNASPMIPLSVNP
jgi:hypothetical protein